MHSKRVERVRARLDSDLVRAVAELGVPGASLAALVDGQVIECVAGVLNTRTRQEVAPESLFPIQSITKVWTATLAMQLVDDGLIDLDAPVRAHLPGFRTADERASSAITSRHLLTHTAGFEGDLWAPTTSGPDALERFVTDLVAQAAQNFHPGAMFSYCNAGVGVLGHLVERLRGLSFDTAVRRLLTEPLGTDEIAFCADEALGFSTAIGHRRLPDGALVPLASWAPLPPSNPAAGNQLAMSARALLSFGAMHAADGVTRSGVPVLSGRSARAMRERQVLHPGPPGSSVGHGLGWVTTGRGGLVEHGGGAHGIESLLQVVPEAGVAIALLTNGNGAIGPLGATVIDPLLQELAAIDPPGQVQPLAAVAPVDDPSRYVGRYETRVTANHVSVDGKGRLWLEVSDRNEAIDVAARAGVPLEAQRYRLHYLGDDTMAPVNESGGQGPVIQFHGSDRSGAALFLRACHAAGRAAPRIAQVDADPVDAG